METLQKHVWCGRTVWLFVSNTCMFGCLFSATVTATGTPSLPSPASAAVIAALTCTVTRWTRVIQTDIISHASSTALVLSPDKPSKTQRNGTIITFGMSLDMAFKLILVSFHRASVAHFPLSQTVRQYPSKHSPGQIDNHLMLTAEQMEGKRHWRFWRYLEITTLLKYYMNNYSMWIFVKLFWIHTCRRWAASQRVDNSRQTEETAWLPGASVQSGVCMFIDSQENHFNPIWAFLQFFCKLYFWCVRFIP